MAEEAQTVERPEEDFSGVVARWEAEIKAYQKLTEPWRKDSKRIVDRYKLEKRRGRAQTVDGSQFNILYANVKTAGPALYNRTPVPSIERRHRDQDIVGRVAATMLERAVATELEFDDLDTVLKAAVLDYQLTGRGVVWVRYEATIADEEVVSERAPVDYGYWEDFGHTPAKSWVELRKSGAVWKCVSMTRDQLVERFGDLGRKVELTDWPKGMSEESDGTDQLKGIVKTAKVYEIWDAKTRRIYWVNFSVKDKPLDTKDFILDLTTDFPCPRPALGTITNDSLIPVPDYLQYEDLADELDDLTDRISVLQEALQARGVYDGSAEGLGRLLASGTPENALVPVENWPALQAKGGAEKAIVWLPIDIIAQVIAQLELRREALKAQIFEISGLSDIIRGQVDPREKLGQSRIKGQFATLRLDDGQKEIARLARDIVRIKAEIIAEQFGARTIRELSGFDQMSEVVRLREQDESGLEVEKLFAAAVELIRNDRDRGFRIDIETDSTVAIDEEEAKASRIEFMTAVGNFLEQALPVAQQVPQLAPLMGETLLFLVRSMKAGRALESAFEDAMDQIRAAAEQPQQAERPDPEMLKVEAQQQEAAGRLQVQREKIQGELQLAAQKQQGELALKQREQEGDDVINKQLLQMVQQGNGGQDMQAMSEAARVMAEGVAQLNQAVQAISQAAQQFNQPRRVVRGADGRVAGLEVVSDSSEAA